MFVCVYVFKGKYIADYSNVGECESKYSIDPEKQSRFEMKIENFKGKSILAGHISVVKPYKITKVN